jgi:preprotein translocase subunit SecY
MLALIGQIAFGGFLILLMDEVVSKWGIGSGVSLFIAAGVTKTIFVRTFNPITPLGGTLPAGLVPQAIALFGTGNVSEAITALLPIFSTIIIFLIVVYAQSIKVEIPLAFGSIRGFSRRWPLNLIYTSNIPVILTAALLANLQLVGTMVAAPTETGKCGLLGCFDETGNPTSGLVYYLKSPQILSIHIFFLTLLSVIFLIGFLAFYFKYKGGNRTILIAFILGFASAFLVTSSFVGLPTSNDVLRSITYLLFMVTGSVIFSIFWVATAGMDARSVSEQIEGMGMQIPGFRRDPRIVEQVLNRYIPSLAIISGVFIGILATTADLTNAVGTGTGILLTVMIIHNLYEQISMRYMEDMHPALRKFFE